MNSIFSYLLCPFRHTHAFILSNHPGGRDAKVQIPSLQVLVPFFANPSLNRTCEQTCLLHDRGVNLSRRILLLWLLPNYRRFRSVRSLSLDGLWCPKRCVPNGNWIYDCKNEEIYFIFMISTTFHLYKWNTMGYSTISLSDLRSNIYLFSEESISIMHCTAPPLSPLVIRHELTWVSYFWSF